MTLMHCRTRLLFAMCMILGYPSVGQPCSCIAGTLKQEISSAAMVFRGRVIDIAILPERKENPRSRQAVTFATSRWWKGLSSNKITVYVIAPGTDCIGASFDNGEEYLVFADAALSRDVFLEHRFWYGWKDVLPEGEPFLTVNNFCDSTARVSLARKTLRRLGRGTKP